MAKTRFSRNAAVNRAKNRYGTHSETVRAAGAELLAFVVAKGWHKAELAEKIGVDPSSCTRYFAGQRSPKPDTRKAIRKLTGIAESRWTTAYEARVARKGAK